MAKRRNSKAEREARRILAQQEISHQRKLAKRRFELTEAMIGVAERGIQALGGYSSAERHRLSPTSAGAHLGGSTQSHRDQWTLQEIRKACQNAERNNVLARAVIQAVIDLDCADGFVTRSATGDQDWDEEADRLFEAWWNDPAQCDIAGQLNGDGYCEAALRAALVDGDMAVLLTSGGALQAIEAERVINPRGALDGKPTDRGTTFFAGVERDRAGRPVAYSIGRWSGTESYVDFDTELVAAGGVLFLANPLQAWPGAVRGEPQLQAALRRLEDIDSLDEAVRTGAWIQACQPIFISVERPDLHQANAFGVTDQSVSDGAGNEVTQRQEAIEPGMINRLKPNEKIQAVQATQPMPAVNEYVRMQMAMIGGDIGLPWCNSLLDGTGLNLSTIRCIIQLAWRRALRRQNWLRLRLIAPVRRWKTAQFIARGLLAFREDWDRFDVIAPPAPVMDPMNELNYARGRVDAGLASEERVMQETWGINRATEKAKIAAERKDNAANGTGATATVAGAPTTATAAQSDTDTPDKPEKPE